MAGGSGTRSAGLLRVLRSSASALADLLLPRTCVGCGRALDAGDDKVVCGMCWGGIVMLPSPQCARCGHPTWGRPCRWCQLLPAYVRAVRSVCWATSGTARGLLRALKYDGWSATAVGMAARMARLAWPPDVREERTVLVPVPLASARARHRGYNQSERLAAALAPYWAVPTAPHALARTRETSTQTRLTPEERVRNVRGAFRVMPAARQMLRGTHVVLVDDVVTTAATLNACAAALCDDGARIVSYVTFGRAPAVGDPS